ncbi:DUF6274 family protein [Streptomyces sp. NPDC001070]
MTATPRDPGPTPRDETRALLRAHPAGAPGGRRRHLTRHRPACHRLTRPALRRPAAPLPHDGKPEQDCAM